MNPARSRHSEYQGAITYLLRQMLPRGLVLPKCPVQTSDGVRVPDVAWSSPERRQPVVYTLAPEICVEVMSPHNDEREMIEKRRLYFEAGALECWQCSENGSTSFYSPRGAPEGASALCPGFPTRVVVLE